MLVQESTGVFEFRVNLVVEGLAVDRAAAASGARRVASLYYEVAHDPVELAAVVVALQRSRNSLHRLK